MNIAIDYDDTFVKDPELWTAFIKAAESRGHRVWCVTKREPNLGTPGLSITTIYSSRKSKISAVMRQGIHIDIWIDDSPLGIYADDGQRVSIG